MSSFSKHYSVLLNTLDACWITVDGWSNSSRCRQESVYLHMDVMHIYMIIAFNDCHNYALFYQLPNSNLFTHRMLYLREKPLANTMAPGSIHLYICKRYYYLAAFIYFLFILHLSTIIYTTHLLANNKIKGIDNPLARVGCKCVLFCV